MTTNTTIDSSNLTKISNLFKSYDIRGAVGDLNATVYYLAAKGLVEKVLKPEGLPLSVNMAHDARYSSPEFFAAFCQGLTDAGAKPVSIGLAASELLYAACQLNDYPGVMITASHNPKDDNGAKILKKSPQMLGLGSGLELVRDYVIEELKNGFSLESANISIEKEIEIDKDFAAKVVTYWQDKMALIGDLEGVNQFWQNSTKKLKVVVDTANGMGGLLMGYIAKMYPGIDFVPMFWELDGTFPNHPADPLQAKNMQYLQEAVKREGADLGAAFDGDADRCFFVDEKGQIMNNENLVALFSKYMLKQLEERQEKVEKTDELKAAIVYVISYSRALADTVLENGGAAVVCKQGHTHVKNMMKKYQAIYGGEASGHNYFGDFGFMDSGGLTLALMLKILTQQPDSASHLLDYWNNIYYTSGEHNFKIPDGLDMPKIKEIIKQKYSDASISELDGISVFYPFWKFTIRGSNTEPLVRINVETQMENKAMQKLEELKTLFNLA